MAVAVPPGRGGVRGRLSGHQTPEDSGNNRTHDRVTDVERKDIRFDEAQTATADGVQVRLPARTNAIDAPGDMPCSSIPVTRGIAA